MIKQWITYLAALLAGIVFYIAYQQWMAWLLLMALLWLPIFSLLVSLPAMLTAKFSLGKSARITAGSRVTFQARISCRFPLPPHRCRIRVTRVLTEESWLLYPGDNLPTDHCGQLVCQPEKIRVYDYLGLFHRTFRNCGDVQWLVCPTPLPVKMSQYPERYLPQAWRPKPGGGFAENHEMRLYRPGDSLNQVHWKLSAKTGKLIIREAMEPVRRRLLLSLDLNGTPEELDRKLGRFLWLGNYLLSRDLSFEICALTGHGIAPFSISSEQSLTDAMDSLLRETAAAEGTAATRNFPAAWRLHIGGEPDEA